MKKQARLGDKIVIGDLVTVRLDPDDGATIEEVSPRASQVVRRGPGGRRPKVVAVGECGLDYFRDLSPRPVQRQVFARHLALAREQGLPVIVHCREAYADCLDILATAGPAPLRGVLHCFQGDAAVARGTLDLGLFLGIGGAITFPREAALRGVVGALPVGRLVVETDAPYLTPRPHRGRNEPAHVRLVAERLALLLRAPLGRVAEATTRNARELFSLPDA